MIFGAGHRLAIIGLPECGKTNTQMFFVEDEPSVVILDAKYDPRDWPAFGRERGYVVTSDARAIASHPLVVWQVPSMALDDREGWKRPGSIGWQWTLALDLIYERWNTIVVFAEALRLLPSAGANPRARRIFSEGRSRNLRSIFDIQIPNTVDTLAIRTSEHCLCYQTIDTESLDIIRGRRGVDPTPLKTLEPFEAAYHRLGRPAWELGARFPLLIRTSKRATRAPSPDLDNAASDGSMPPLQTPEEASTVQA